MSADLPPEGWVENRRGDVTYTVHGPSWDVKPPERDGYRCSFIARHGVDYTTWTYRPIKEA
jgi:hypothetical protein